MWPTTLLLIYCVLVVLSSLAGGALPSLVKLTHTRMQSMMSFVGGLMLGVALLHMLPHALAHNPNSVDAIAISTVAGLLTMFFLIRIFHVHQHEHDETSCAHQHHHGDHHHGEDHDHEGAAAEEHGGESAGAEPPQPRQSLGWLGIMIGLSLHTLIDGVALAASVSADSHAVVGTTLLGVGTFGAVFFHKPLDALSITWLMSASGWSRRGTLVVNLCFALMCPLGALGFYFGLANQMEQYPIMLSAALGFSAGAFLCISLADLLPEVQFHSHDRVRLSACLLLGVLAAYGIGFLEPEHSHGQRPDGGHHPEQHGHPH